MKEIITIFLVALIFSFHFSTFAQRYTPGAPVKMVEKVIPLEILDPVNNFADKGLPEPFIIGYGRTDETAARIAKELSKYEENSLPYLIGTLQKAGFYIINEDLKVLYRPTVDKNGTGLAFYDFEVVGMLKLSRAGYVTTVGKLANLIGKEFPVAKRQKFGQLMLEDLRSAANLSTLLTSGEKSSGKERITKRFLARLIIEIGKQFPQPVDLMTASPETAQLNIIQASLWQRRMVGDLIAYATKQNGSNFGPRQNLKNLIKPKSDAVSFRNASYSNPVAPDEPCNYANEETTEMDAVATALTTIHGKIFEAMVDTGVMPSLEKIGKGLGVANLVLSWAKLVAAASQLKGTIKVEEPMPLIRTKSSIATGEKRLLTGRFEIKVNSLRQLNCVRTSLNMATGLDFNMPGSGPLTEKPVSWELGGDVSFKGQNSSQTGEYDQVVYLLPVDGANRDHHKQETDANGESKIFLEGAKQKKDLNNQKVVPLPKRASVRADVALKNMKDSKQEMVDIGSFALGVATGGGLLGILSAIPEIGNRMKIPVVAVNVPIRDWTPCSEDWGGTISVIREFQQTIVVKSTRLSNGNGTGDGVRHYSRVDKADITLNPRRPEQMQEKNPNPATIVLWGKHSDITNLLSVGDPCCGATEGDFLTRYRRGQEMTYSNIVKNRVSVRYKGGDRDYSLGFSFSTGSFPAKQRDFNEVLETNCDEYDEPEYSNETDFPWSTGFLLDPGRFGQRLVNSAGEVLFGGKQLDMPDGSKETWTWALARCQP